MVEYKTLTPDRVKATGERSAELVLGTLGVIDSDADVVMPGSIGEQMAPLIPCHDWNAVPLGKGRVFERGNLIIGQVVFNGTPEADSWHTAIMFDYENPPVLQQYSWGYTPDQSRPGRMDGQPVRFLEALTIHEISPVLLGASVGTHTAAVKSSPLSADQRAVIQRAQDHIDRAAAERRAWLKRIHVDLVTDLRVARWCADLGELYGGKLFPMNSDAVSPSVRAYVMSAVRTFAGKLNTVIPTIKWFEQPHLTIHGGCNRRFSTILVNAHQSRADLWRTVAHEMGHLVGMNEAEAHAYETIAQKECTP